MDSRLLLRKIEVPATQLKLIYCMNEKFQEIWKKNSSVLKMFEVYCKFINSQVI